MVAMRVFPWMLIVVIHSLTVWTCIAGLLGEYVIPCVFIYLLAALVFQIFANKCACRKGLSYRLLVSFGIFLALPVFFVFGLLLNHHGEKNWLTTIGGVSGLCVSGILTLYTVLGFNLESVDVSREKTNQTEQSLSEKSVFMIKSVLTSVWLPCVVGSKPFTFSLSSTISLFYKNFLFLLAILLNYFQVIQINVFLFWCVDLSKIAVYEAKNLTICHSFLSCFNSTGGTTTEQKICVCHENQNVDFLFVSLTVLNVLSLLSVIASVNLENCTDYVYLYKSTKSFLCFPTNPVVHRSLVFTLASSDEHQQLLEEVAKDTGMINRPRRGETPLHYSTKMGAARCTETLLRKGAQLKENGETPPVVPPILELAVRKRYAPILDTIVRIKQQTNPDYLSDREIMSTLQRQDQTLMKTSLSSPAVARSMLNLLLSIDTTREEGTKTPELEFLQNRLRTLGLLPDERKTREESSGDILTLPTIVSLLTWKNQSRETVLQDKTVGKDNLKMMLALAWAVMSKKPELIPDVREGILNLGDSDFITAQAFPLKSSALAKLMTHTNAQGETLLQEKTLNKNTHKILLSLALSLLEDVPSRSEEGEERIRLEAAAKVLPELVNIRSEQVSKLYPKMKEILSRDRNQKVKEVKGELEKNTSIPPDVRKELGLEPTSDNIV